MPKILDLLLSCQEEMYIALENADDSNQPVSAFPMQTVNICAIYTFLSMIIDASRESS